MSDKTFVTRIKGKFIINFKNNIVTLDKKSKDHIWGIPSELSGKLQTGDVVIVLAPSGKKRLFYITGLLVECEQTTRHFVFKRFRRSTEIINVKFQRMKRPDTKEKNSGYIKNERSNRSREAIDNFCMPISHFKRSVVNDFINNLSKSFKRRHNLSSAFMEEVKEIPINVWVYVAKIKGAKEWHHTSPLMNKTDHYCLKTVLLTFKKEGIKRVTEAFEKQKKIMNNPDIVLRDKKIPLCDFSVEYNHPNESAFLEDLLAHDKLTMCSLKLNIQEHYYSGIQLVEALRFRVYDGKLKKCELYLPLSKDRFEPVVKSMIHTVNQLSIEHLFDLRFDIYHQGFKLFDSKDTLNRQFIAFDHKIREIKTQKKLKKMKILILPAHAECNNGEKLYHHHSAKFSVYKIPRDKIQDLTINQLPINDYLV